MNRFADAAASLLFPAHCAFCNGVTVGKARCCPKCESRFHIGDAGAARVHSELTIYSCFHYKEECKRALADFKFYRNTQFVDYFAEELSKLIEERTGGFAFDHVVYLPMPELRERERGYNQGKLLAEAVAARHNMECERCGLTRQEIFAQHDLNGTMRRKQLYGGYGIEEGTRLCGSVLLVDDVVTTGSSLIGCARLLHGAGAGKITAITVAG